MQLPRTWIGHFAAPVKLASLNPHMHLRGKDFVYRLVYPTGESEIILNVPKYDYAYQPGLSFREDARVCQPKHCAMK